MNSLDVVLSECELFSVRIGQNIYVFVSELILYKRYIIRVVLCDSSGLPGVLWVLPDSYLDVPNKDYGGL